MRNIIITTLATTIIAVSFNANARFSKKLEYKVIKNCIHNTWSSDDTLKTCTCALKKSNNNGYYRNGSFQHDETGFFDEYEKNIKICRK
jgi:hypothetical protein